MTEFFQTMLGKRFYESTVPQLTTAVSKLAVELKRYNDYKEAPKEDKGPH